MDEPGSAELRGDGAENKPSVDQTPPGDRSGPSVEHTAEGLEVLCCQDCGQTFKEESSYAQHLLQHQQSNADMDNHAEGFPDVENVSNTPLYCASCALAFVNQSDFDLHMKEQHPGSPKESTVQNNGVKSRRAIYECPDCGKSYKLLGLLRNHERTHRPPPKSYYDDIERLKKKSFQCEICERSYTRASALDAHRRCHQEKLIKSKTKSPEAEMQTAVAKEEVKTSETHPVDPATHFDCPCGKSFLNLMRLKTHQRFSRNTQCSPEKKKPKSKKATDAFECSECKRVFSNYIALFNHQRWHANQSNGSTNKFSCEECGKEFQSLSFYYKHQRTAHSGEAPAKSFLHQVCQLQKKAIECEECGLKFSRPSALHSHQLQHTNAFKDGDKDPAIPYSQSPQRMAKFGKKEKDGGLTSMEGTVQSDGFSFSSLAEETPAADSDDEMEGYELSDFNVQVISASESEDEPIRDLNPDLELLCESDQEGRDEGETGVSSGLNNMDLKIVQIDLEAADEPCALMPTDAVDKGRFGCSECGGWYSSASSLRIHRRWHDAQKRRQQTEGQSAPANTGDASYYTTHCNRIQSHYDPESNYVMHPAEGSEEKSLVCNECGQVFSHLSALTTHQSCHLQRDERQCPYCFMSYSHSASLANHMQTCSMQKKGIISAMKKEYNPKKTLLGPKTYHCEQCGKGFWSLGAYSHHMQSETECADLRLRKGFTGSTHSANRHTRSAAKVACPVCGRKFRHKRIMTLHMRKHENGNHKCELCNRSFRLVSSLLRHQVVHRDQFLPPPVKSFQHQMEQLKKNTYSCPDCGKLFSRAKALQFHMKSHGYEMGQAPSSSQSSTVLEDLQCTTCFSLFNSKASLRTHQKLCTKRRRDRGKTEESVQNMNALKLRENNIASSVHERLDHGTVPTEGMYESSHKEAEGTSPINSKDKLESSRTGKLATVGEERESFSVSATINFHRLHDDRDLKQKGDDLYPQMFIQTNQEDEKSDFTCLECGRGFLSNWALSSHKRWHRKNSLVSSLEEVNIKLFKTDAHDLTQTAKSENEQSKCSEPSGLQEDKVLDDPEDKPSQHVEENSSESVKPDYQTCPICFMTFAKARGLRAHNWQVHSRGRKGKRKGFQRTKTDSRANKSEPKVCEPPPLKPVPAEEERAETEPSEKTFSCNSGKESSCPDVLVDDKKLLLDVKQDSKMECQSSEASTEVSSPLAHGSDFTFKCFFKCNKCGKAFQTEEQLGAHRAKAKSRPFCCALCCHSFWTRIQLQQHLAWHDEVRCRLPNEVRYRLSSAISSKLFNWDNRAPSLTAPASSERSSQLASPSQSSHKCQNCGKAFLSPSALQRHNSQLCSTVLYSCPACPRTFSGIQELIDHHQRCIGGDKGPAVALAAVPSEDTNEFICYDCGISFNHETDLHQHYCDHIHQEHYT